LILTHDKNRAEVDHVIAQAKKELRSLFVKSEDQIKKVGNALKKVVKKEESICEEIKIALKEEIAEGVISTRTIELHCPPEWKHKTKPKQRENEKISFSKPQQQQQQQIAATQEGKSVIVNEPSSNTNTSSDDVSQLHEQSKQNGIAIDKSASYSESSTINNFPDSDPSYKQTGRQECSSCLELQDKVIQLSEALKRISIPTADQILISGFEIPIPKENYEMVKDAMDKSNSTIFVKCDAGKKFVRAVADVDN
jgi:biopolymer transport protein ExbD